jgi:hypothetical protein
MSNRSDFLPFINVGPRLSIVSFNTNPKLYSDVLSSTSPSAFIGRNFLNPAVRILTVAEAKEENTFQNEKLTQ